MHQVWAFLVGSAMAGAILWDGRFNDFTSSTDFNNWSWTNEVGPYQYYIVCLENTRRYHCLDPHRNSTAPQPSQHMSISRPHTKALQTPGASKA
jgi:hypothetical protein